MEVLNFNLKTNMDASVNHNEKMAKEIDSKIDNDVDIENKPLNNDAELFEI